MRRKDYGPGNGAPRHSGNRVLKQNDVTSSGRQDTIDFPILGTQAPECLGAYSLIPDPIT